MADISTAHIQAYHKGVLGSALPTLVGLSAGHCLALLGYTSIGDGGDGMVRWDPTDTSTAQDSVSTWGTTGYGRWKRILGIAGTAAPTTGIGAGNTAGVAATYARSDHDHKLRTGSTDLTIGTVADGDLVRRSGTTLVTATATQATAILNAMVGDSGAGGTKGLVPAPSAGDAAATKFLKADGTWTAVTAGITALTGDVTASGSGSVAAAIANSAVTLAKMSDLATDRLIGRSTAGTGVPEAIICTAAGRALIDDASASAQRTTLGLGTLATQSALTASDLGVIWNIRTTDKSATLGTSAQAIFDSAQDRFTPTAFCYYHFEAYVRLHTTGAVGTWQVNFTFDEAGTCITEQFFTCNSMQGAMTDGTVASYTAYHVRRVTAGGQVGLSDTSSSRVLFLQGYFLTGSSGVIKPDIAFSVAPSSATNIKAGTYVKLTPLGDYPYVGGWS